jgi:hypothetical protein
VGHRYIVKEDF